VEQQELKLAHRPNDMDGRLCITACSGAILTENGHKVGFSIVLVVIQFGIEVEQHKQSAGRQTQ
jgi:hypothetical protein